MRGQNRLASREWYVRVAFEGDRESRAVEVVGKEPEFTGEKNLI